jgi:hypothetical protein
MTKASRVISPAASSFPDSAFSGRPPSHRWRGRLLLDQHPVQLPEIAVIEQPANHVRRDQPPLSRLSPLSPAHPGHAAGSKAGADRRPTLGCIVYGPG